ncbi:MAG: AI-2E family transporter [Acidobacteria bacterium]|nr:AI-2E family transporter [Acidobacteriota bacterium]
MSDFSFSKHFAKAWVRSLIYVLAVLVTLILLISVREVIAPVLIALITAYVFDPVIDRFEAWKIPRTWGIILLLFILSLILTGFALYVIPRLIEQINDLADRLPVYLERLRVEFMPEFQQFKVRHQDEFNEAMVWLQEQAKSHGGTLVRGLSSSIAASFKSLGSFLAGILGFIVVPVLTFYLLRDFDIMKVKASELIPLGRREAVVSLFSEIDRALGSFLKGQLTVAVILALIYAVGLFFAKCPAFLLIAVIAGFANLVPYLGIALGMLPAIGLTYLSTHSWVYTLVAAITFVVGQMLEGMVITPKIVGESVGLHPVLVMIALMVGGSYFGISGMILALPTSAVLMVIVKRAYRGYLSSELYHEGILMRDSNPEDVESVDTAKEEQA